MNQMFYKYDFEENIDKLQIENLEGDQLSVEISIKPRASAFVERKMFRNILFNYSSRRDIK
jgi:hypothetical protein